MAQTKLDLRLITELTGMEIHHTYRPEENADVFVAHKLVCGEKITTEVKIASEVIGFWRLPEEYIAKEILNWFK